MFYAMHFFLDDSIFSRYIPDAESAFKVADIYDSTNFDIIIHVQSYVNILGHAGVLMPFVIVCARSSYVVGRKNNITFITSSKLRSHLLPNKIWSFVRIRNIKKKIVKFYTLPPQTNMANVQYAKMQHLKKSLSTTIHVKKKQIARLEYQWCPLSKLWNSCIWLHGQGFRP